MKTTSGVKRFVSAWNDFWFSPEDPLSLGVLRVLVGGMLTYTHFVWGLELDAFFGPDGWQSTEAVREFFQDDWLPSLWWYVPADSLRLVHILCFIPLVLFLFGVATPVTSVLALVITISNSNRAPLANYGLDQLLSLLTLYLVIGGSGGACSVDAWLRKLRWERDTPATAFAPEPYLRPRTSRVRLGTRLIQVHFCVIYFFAGISKLQGESWWNGEALWRAFANQEYQSIDMTWLAHYTWLLQIATHVTIFWEISFPFLVWNRTLRPLVLVIGVLMHAGIGLCMGMITFGSIMIFGYLAFVPPARLQRLFGAIGVRLTGEMAPDPDLSLAPHPMLFGEAPGDLEPPPHRPTPAPGPSSVVLETLQSSNTATISSLDDVTAEETTPVTVDETSNVEFEQQDSTAAATDQDKHDQTSEVQAPLAESQHVEVDSQEVVETGDVDSAATGIDDSADSDSPVFAWMEGWDPVEFDSRVTSGSGDGSAEDDGEAATGDESGSEATEIADGESLPAVSTDLDDLDQPATAEPVFGPSDGSESIDSEELELADTNRGEISPAGQAERVESKQAAPGEAAASELAESSRDEATDSDHDEPVIVIDSEIATTDEREVDDAAPVETANVVTLETPDEDFAEIVSGNEIEADEALIVECNDDASTGVESGSESIEIADAESIPTVSADLDDLDQPATAEAATGTLDDSDLLDSEKLDPADTNRSEISQAGDSDAVELKPSFPIEAAASELAEATRAESADSDHDEPVIVIDSEVATTDEMDVDDAAPVEAADADSLETPEDDFAEIVSGDESESDEVLIVESDNEDAETEGLETIDSEGIESADSPDIELSAGDEHQHDEPTADEFVASDRPEADEADAARLEPAVDDQVDQEEPLAAPAVQDFESAATGVVDDPEEQGGPDHESEALQPDGAANEEFVETSPIAFDWPTDTERIESPELEFVEADDANADESAGPVMEVTDEVTTPSELVEADPPPLDATDDEPTAEVVASKTAEDAPVNDDAGEVDRPVQRSAKPAIAVCDPDWKYRSFAHYLTRRGFPTYLGTSPVAIWRFVETHEVEGAVFFVDRMRTRDYELLLRDLTLSPLDELPVVLAVRRNSRVQQALQMESPTLKVVRLPQTFRVIREAMLGLLDRSDDSATDRPSTSVDDAATPHEKLSEVRSADTHLSPTGDEQ